MRWIRFFLLVLSLLLFLVSCNASGGEILLEAVFADVGQGDAILLRTDGGDILIDAGPDGSEAELCLLLEDLGVEWLSLAIFTHSDEDHIGGADGVLSRFGADAVWVGPSFQNKNEAERLLFRAAEACGAAVRTVCAGEKLLSGSTAVTVLFPFSLNAEGEENDESLVIKAVCGEVGILLMGDAGIRSEEMLLAQYGSIHLSSNLLKVGHHGSETSTGADFLAAVSPEWAVISCGAGNSYGHPHGSVLQALQAVGAAVERTDLSGTVTFTTDGMSLEKR